MTTKIVRGWSSDELGETMVADGCSVSLREGWWRLALVDGEEVRLNRYERTALNRTNAVRMAERVMREHGIPQGEALGDMLAAERRRREAAFETRLTAEAKALGLE